MRFVRRFIPRMSMLVAVGAIGSLALPSARAGTELRPAPISSPSDARDSDEAAPPPIEEILVTGRPIAQELTYQRPTIASTAAADSAALLRGLPGADFARIGPLTGQTYYRGLTDIRMGVRVDGARLTSGGPNLMDPPLHYVPPPLVERLILHRGIAPVSAGVGLNAPVEAVLRRSSFRSVDEPRYAIDASAGFRSAEEGVFVGGIVSRQGRTSRAHVLGSFEDGDDLRVPGGRLADTAYRRVTVGAGVGWRFAAGGELALDYRYHHSRAGTPALPLDVRLFRTHLAKARYTATIGRLRFEARIHGERVRHEMDNFSMRSPPPSPATFRLAPAQAHTIGYAIEARLPGRGGRWIESVTVGVDGRVEDHDTDITNPNNPAFFVRNIHNARSNRRSLWAEVALAPAPAIALQWGLRWNHVHTTAGAVAVSAILPPPVKLLAARFNAADRSRTDDLIDSVLRVTWQSGSALAWHLGLGHRTRAPIYVERYAWLPLEITAGLADGNNHVGRIDLKPERMWAVDGGFDLDLGWLRFSPRLFWQRIDDYIQGLPADATPSVIDTPLEMVSAANGDPTPLVFSNVNARIWGADLRAVVTLGEHLLASATGLYNRGRRRDVADNLYRIAPPRLTLALGWQEESWSVTAETRLVARQTKVSATNDERPTDGYAIVNLRGELRLGSGLRLIAGVENLFDRRYAEHLGGFNRVRGSVVPPGARLPGAGINGFVRLVVDVGAG